MKKKLFFAAVALVMTAATAVGYKAYDKGNMSEFMMANIEALTTDESSRIGSLYSNISGTEYCCGKGNVRDCEGYELCPDEYWK